MYVKLLILNNNRTNNFSVQPLEFEFKGDTAIEQMILKAIEIYFGDNEIHETKILLRETKENLRNILKIA